ncbi:helix-turn-helix transcriptional regulator [Undibacterium sp. Di26W]|uniref:helix-turn-helix transcriptional regulator n=1 Tax=Undibacterium sp. Di26W TaxID=3413035 RepID=UPI003BF3661B
MTTKNNILNALRRESLTVIQLCEHLGVTRNAINVQLKQLEAEGRVRRKKGMQTGVPGKPAITYEAAPGSEDATSKAYPVFLMGLISTLRKKLNPDEMLNVLDETGRNLARTAGLSASADFNDDLSRVMKVADSMGASTEAIAVPGGIMVRNYSCPVGGAVRSEPCLCVTLAALFSEATGKPVTERCLRDDRLICQYFIEIEKELKEKFLNSLPGQK